MDGEVSLAILRGWYRARRERRANQERARAAERLVPARDLFSGLGFTGVPRS
jgi:hypothetical protein